jgi:adhesin transport system membrane fusion protein
VLSLEGESAALQASIARLNGEIARYALRAPVSGTVAEVAALRTGAYVAQGQRLVTIVPPGEFAVIADFAPATVLGRIHRGQLAMLRLDGFPWPQYGGIAARVTRVSGELRDGLVRVEFAPELATARHFTLQHGLPGSIEVALEQVSPLQLLLRSAGRMDGAASTTTGAPPPREMTAP